ncbi:MAG: hypothetical protein OIF40_11075 [Mangrovicoccus sp.]|nr:hypothetical protein [Mangrovicoccus sp.]
MIPLGDVPFLMDTSRWMLPHYTRRAARGVKRAARRLQLRKPALPAYGQPHPRPVRLLRLSPNLPPAPFSPRRTR